MSRDIIAASIGKATLICMRFIASSLDAVSSCDDTSMHSMKTAVLQSIVLLPLSSTKPLKKPVARGSIIPTSVTISVSAMTAA